MDERVLESQLASQVILWHHTVLFSTWVYVIEKQTMGREEVVYNKTQLKKG